MTALLSISKLPDGYMCVDRYEGSNLVEELRLRLAPTDTVQDLKDYLEAFRLKGLARPGM